MSTHRHQPEPDFDPDAARLRQRLRELRGRSPGLILATELTHIHDDQVVVRAMVTLPDGDSVSAHAAEPTDSSGLLDGAIELAEQRSITRALDLLAQGEIVAGALRSGPARREPEGLVAEPSAGEESPPPVVDALRKASLRRQSDVAPATPQETGAEVPRPIPRPITESTVAEPEQADEPDLADYTWTHFWTWARAHDLSTKGQVEQRIGRAIDSLTPRDVRRMLHESGIPL